MYGAISDLIRDKAKEQRRAEAGLLPPPSPWTPPTAVSKEVEHERWMEGGTVLIGRHTFKEYMHGLRRGWTEPLQAVDNEELLANRLSEDGHFDEPEEPFAADTPGDASDNASESSSSSSPNSSSPIRPPSSLFAPLSGKQQSAKPISVSAPFTTPDSTAQVPDSIPPQPPLLLVYYPNRLGFTSIPMIIADFFNERKNVRIGCEAAYQLVLNESRPLVPPTSTTNTHTELESSSSAEEHGLSDTKPTSPTLGPELGLMGQGGDLDFAAESEDNFGRSFEDLPKVVNKARESYYKELPSKLKLARELARGDREPTKDETNFPPSTEVELRAQRLSKEKKWTSDEQAWKWLRAGSGVTWDERFESALRVFTKPSEETELLHSRPAASESTSSDSLSTPNSS